MLDRGQIEAYANGALQNAVTYSDGVISGERANSWRYFDGETQIPTVPGRSSVVTRDVLETVLWMMPSLMRIFFGGDDIVKFEPRQEGDEASADQATEYCNYVLRQQNRGFELFYEMFMDALMQKSGVVKVYWDDRKVPEKEEYEGLSGEQMAMLQQDGWEIVEAESRPDPQQFGDDPDDEVALMMMAGAQIPLVYDVKVRRERDESQVRIYGVPPEEFLVSRLTRAIDEEEGGVFHRRRISVSDLVAEGYRREDVESLPGYDEEAEFAPESLARHDDDDFQSEAYVQDPSARKVWVTECYVLLDMDDDGIAELRKVTIAGGSRATGRMLVHPDDEDEGGAPEVKVIPFASVCPIPLPHRFYGLSLSDVVMDLQDINTVLVRQSLDSLYLANNPRFFAQGGVNLDDLLTSRPGGVVRGEMNSLVQPLNTEFVGAASFPMLDYVDRKRQARTGVSKYGVGVEANKLQNESATAAIQESEAANERVELVARIFAETGISRLFRLILHAAATHQSQPTIVRLRDKYVPVDPNGWDNRFDMSVRVGLGTGNRDRKAQGLAQFVQLLTMLRQDPEYRRMITADRVYNVVEDAADALNLGKVERYLMDPRQLPPPEPQQNPEAQKAQAEMQMKQQEMQAKLQQSQAETQARMQQAQAEAQARVAMERDKMQMQLQADQQRAHVQAEMERQKAEASLVAERERWQQQIALDRDRAVWDHDLATRRMDEEFAIRRQELQWEADLERLKMAAGSRDGQGNIDVSDD